MNATHSTPNTFGHKVNISISFFLAKSRATIHLLTLLSNFKRFCKKFESELIRSNSDDEILFNIGQATISIVRLADETGLSNTPPTTTSSTSKLDAGTVTNTPSAANDLNNDALNFDLSKILSCTLMASLTTKGAIPKQMPDCILNNYNEESSKQISPYKYGHWKYPHVKNCCVCVDKKIDPKFDQGRVY